MTTLYSSMLVNSKKNNNNNCSPQSIAKLLKKKFPKLDIVGSILHNKEHVKDIDILIYRDDLFKLLYAVPKLKIIKLYKNKAIANYNHININIDIFFHDKTNYLFLKFMLQSPKSYNIRIRHLAKLKGYKLSQYGLFKLPNMIPIKVKNERHLTSILGITNRNYLDRK